MNKNAKNSVIYLLGTVMMAILGFASTIILTRVLSNKVYAMYGLFANFSTAIMSFVSFGYDTAYTRFYYNHGYTQKKFMHISLRVPLVLFCVLALVVLEPTHTVIKYVFESDISFVAILAFLLYILLSIIHKFVQLTSRMEERAGNYVISNAFAKSGFLIFVIAAFFIFKTVSFEVIVISFAIGSLVAVLINMWVYCRVVSNKSVILLDAHVRNLDLLKYGLPYMLNNVFLLIIPVVEKIIIRDLAGWELLSIFTAASIFQTVVMMLQGTINNIWLPIVFKHCDNEKVFKPMLHKFGTIITTVLTFCLALCTLLRRWLVIVLDENYYSVYLITPAVFFISCFSILTLIYSVGINIKKKTFYLIISPMIQAILSVLLSFVLIPRFGLIGIALSMLGSQIISKIFKICVGLSLYGTGDQEWKVFLLTIVSIVSVIASLYLNSFMHDLINTAFLVLAILIIMNKDLVLAYKEVFKFVKTSIRKQI